MARDALTLGQLVVFAGLLQQFSTQITGHGDHREHAGAERDRRAPRVRGAGRARRGRSRRPEPGARCARCRGAVRFEERQLRLTRARLVLDGVDFAVAPGRCVAFVGATGAGKSTLLGLVPRFADPARGRRADRRRRRARAGPGRPAPQRRASCSRRACCFAAPSRTTSRSGTPRRAATAIERAARTAGAHEFIAELPRGYDTLHRGGGPQPVGRAAPAPGDRARDPARAADPAARRSDQRRSTCTPKTRCCRADRGGAPRADDAARHQPLLGAARRRRDLSCSTRAASSSAAPHAALLAAGGLYARAAALHERTSPGGDA